MKLPGKSLPRPLDTTYTRWIKPPYSRTLSMLTFRDLLKPLQIIAHIKLIDLVSSKARTYMSFC
jgi:hypothetical protein